MSKKKKIIYFIPLMLMMLTVFLFSAMPAGQSDATSHSIADPIARILHFFSGEASIVELQDAANWIIRKMAHGIEYMVLALTAIFAFASIGEKKWKILISAEIFCVLYAITDEIHQYFVPGRYMAFVDVVIDGTGALVGVLLCAFFWKQKEKTK